MSKKELLKRSDQLVLAGREKAGWLSEVVIRWKKRLLTTSKQLEISMREWLPDNVRVG